MFPSVRLPALLLLATFMACPLHAQIRRQSTLFPLLATNSRINRPEVFRALQEDIASELGNVEPGLRLDALTNRMAQFRSAVAALNNVRFEVDTGGADRKQFYIVLKGLRAGDSINLAAIHSNVTWDSLKSTCSTQIHDYIVRAISTATTIVNGDKLSQILKETGINGLSTIKGTNATSSGDIANQVASILATIISDRLSNTVFKALGIKANGADTITEVDAAEFAVQQLNKALGQAFTALTDGFNTAEHRIGDAVSHISTFMVSANVGLAVTEGGGDFAGGTHLSLNLCKAVQVGAYFNSHFSPVDTTLADSAFVGRWLVGLQLRLLLADTQVDLLCSRSAGKSGSLNDNTAHTELGFGFSLLSTKYSVVVGAAALYQFGGTNPTSNTASLSRLSAAITLRYADPQSPMLVLGWSWAFAPGAFDLLKPGSSTPLIQLIAPIAP
ncbi:MAG TPA: hypothetical protein VHI13_02740 [Candidatus Kapabacteria bacterium]|nr:hypothetical protein [Candidatus Kapabacteria bacterium]